MRREETNKQAQKQNIKINVSFPVKKKNKTTVTINKRQKGYLTNIFFK